VAFEVVGSFPANGSIGLDPGSTLSVTFSTASDFDSVTTDTVLLTRHDGASVPVGFIKVGTNPRAVGVEPVMDLDPDTRYRLVVKSTVRSSEGVPLGADAEICFITTGPEPTVREDQILDLGDRLNVPRYLARLARVSGHIYVIGGFRNATDATDTVEEWDSGTQSFHLLPYRLLVPRAEFTATVRSDGRIQIVGGVSTAGGDPLDSTEIFDPGMGSTAGPTLLTARRWHAASRFRGSGILVSGGFDQDGDELDSLEVLENNAWHYHTGTLGEPSAQHLQVTRGFDDVYVSVGNLRGMAARVDSVAVMPLQELDSRMRAEALTMSDGRALVVSGDTRTSVIHDFDTGTSWLATDLLFDRRGAFSLTPWGSAGNLYLAAGGFQISAGGRLLDTLEIVEYLSGVGGRPNVVIHTVTGAELPVAIAGHVGFNDISGATVLAGGYGDGVGDHSRRVFMILDDRTTPPATCK